MEKMKNLVGQLQGFEIKEFFEVFSVDEQGLSPKTIGYFKDSKVAKAFAGEDNQSRRSYPVYILTNGTIHILLPNEEMKNPKFFNDEEETLRLKNLALEKLSQADKDLLGL